MGASCDAKTDAGVWGGRMVAFEAAEGLEVRLWKWAEAVVVFFSEFFLPFGIALCFGNDH